MDAWLLGQHGLVLYLALFFMLMAGAVGLPLPEDLPLILGGVLIQTEQVQLWPTLGVCYAALILGDLVVYFVGRRFGLALFKTRWFRSRVPSGKIKSIRGRLERRSLLMIFVARHLFTLRTVTFLTCGAVRMNLRKFLVADCLAALVSLPFFLAVGYLVADNYKMALHYISEAKFMTVIATILLGTVGYWIYRRRRRQLESLVLGENDSGDSDAPNQSGSAN
ncbi:MAG: DedA family protein [Oligoflexia bacterium]|nr:DedA family protein [Oligoflexia bacterium]